MSYQVIWTPLAEDDYSELLEFIDKNYGVDSALEFMDKTDATIERILKFPSIYPISKKRKNVRKAIVTKQTSFLYSIKKVKNEIWILEFWDNRKDS